MGFATIRAWPVWRGSGGEVLSVTSIAMLSKLPAPRGGEVGFAGFGLQGRDLVVGGVGSQA